MRINILFDGPPGPVAGRFIDVLNGETGLGMNVGEWLELENPHTGKKVGYWALHIDPLELLDDDDVQLVIDALYSYGDDPREGEEERVARIKDLIKELERARHRKAERNKA